MIGYKYFEMQDNKKLNILYRGNANGTLVVTSELDGNILGKFEIEPSSEWTEITTAVWYWYV